MREKARSEVQIEFGFRNSIKPHFLNDHGQRISFILGSDLLNGKSGVSFLFLGNAADSIKKGWDLNIGCHSNSFLFLA